MYTIADTGAMLSIGQERSRENAALAAEPSCDSNSTAASTRDHGDRVLSKSFKLSQPPVRGGRRYLKTTLQHSSSKGAVCAFRTQHGWGKVVCPENPSPSGAGRLKLR
jgi:hypothetical protein